MADDATIQNAVETLQRALQTYAGYQGPVNGQLTPEFYDEIANFTSALRQITPVSTELNQRGENFATVYEPILAEVLQGFLSEDLINQLREQLGNDGQSLIVAGLLRGLNVTQNFPAFAQDQTLLISLAEEAPEILSALETLREAGQLASRPQVLTQEQIDAQPEAIQAMETIVRDDLTHYRDYAQGLVEATQAQIDALADDAPEEERAALEATLTTATRTVELLNGGLERIENLDPDQQPDPNFEEALRVYVEFLQRGNNITAFTQTNLDPNEPVEDRSQFVDTSGGFSQEYEDFLSERMEASEERLAELQANDERTPDEEFEFQVLTRTINFLSSMEGMVESGAYIQPALPGADDSGTEEELEVLPVEEARPIIEEALNYMVRTGSIELNPILGEEDDWAFDYDSRLTLQAFLIDLKAFLGIDVDGPESGIYSSGLRTELATAFEDEATRTRVAERYFRGQEDMVLQLLTALNTYAREVPDLEDVPSNIENNVLITMPDLREHEMETLTVAINRIPADEILAMNEMMITITGFGMEDFMPDGTFSEDQGAALELGGDRAEIFNDFYAKIRQESYDAIIRDGRPMSDLEDEITDRMIERFNNLTEDNAAFDVIRLEYMRDYIRASVSEAVAAERALEGSEQNASQQVAVRFADGIPSASTFSADHGPNMRAYFVFDPDEVVGVTPQVMRNFGGEVEGQEAALAEALSQPTIEELLRDMEEDFERLSSSSIAMGTMTEVRDTLSETKSMLERVYNDPRNAEFISENGEMLARGLNGETVLLTMDDDGFQVRYLDAVGINAIEGIDESAILSVGEEFNLDALLIRTATAGYQSMNEGVEWKQSHNPEFFELNGRHYVVGLDDHTNTIRVEELDPEFLSASNAARRVYSALDAEDRATTDEDFMQDPAYRFIIENYGPQLIAAGSVDRIFQLMVQQIGGAEADAALEVLGEYSQIDYFNQPNLEDAPILDDPSILSSVHIINGTRPDENETQPFIYLREGANGETQILVVSPSLKEEVQVADDGTETTVLVYDNATPPVIRDISDPALYQGMRHLFGDLEILPQANLENPVFQELSDWISSGARPILREVSEAPVYNDPTPEGLASLFESASGFNVEGRNLEFGQVITETDTLVAVLGYDPNAAFLQSNLDATENAYVVHGLEANIWQGSDAHHEFLQDHFLVTFMREGEAVTVAIEKEDIANNPLRIEDMLRLEHQEENLGAPVVFAVNRDLITVSSIGVEVPFVDISQMLLMDPPERVMRTLEEGDPYYGHIEEQEFWSDPSWWEMRQDWINDRTQWLRSLPQNEEDGASLETEELSPAQILADNAFDITADHAGITAGDERGLVASVEVGIRPHN